MSNTDGDVSGEGVPPRPEALREAMEEVKDADDNVKPPDPPAEVGEALPAGSGVAHHTAEERDPAMADDGPEPGKQVGGGSN